MTAAIDMKGYAHRATAYRDEVVDGNECVENASTDEDNSADTKNHH